MFESLLLALSLLIAWFWIDTVSKREIAVMVGRELAKRFQLQLLDETVSCKKITLARNNEGRVKLVRLYDFDASPDGNSRLSCNLELIGKQLKEWHIPPYQQPIR